MYYLKIEWYDEYQDTDKINYALVPANSYTAAIGIIVRKFNWINKIEITELNSVENQQAVFIPEECIDKVIQENMY